MHTPPTWTYAQLTELAEEAIRRYMTPTQHEYETKLRQHWAVGVFVFWNRMTMGWQEDGDSERLEALTKRSER